MTALPQDGAAQDAHLCSNEKKRDRDVVCQGKCDRSCKQAEFLLLQCCPALDRKSGITEGNKSTISLAFISVFYLFPSLFGCRAARKSERRVATSPFLIPFIVSDLLTFDVSDVCIAFEARLGVFSELTSAVSASNG